ncbi:TIGR03032 family protein [bacterium]|nr:TIGR03032 family protein [bacterium]
MSADLTPFSCRYTPQVPELLSKLNCSLAISTYQAGKVIFISPRDENYLVQLPRSFNKPMGIALKNEQMAIACADEVIQFSNAPQLAMHYPKSPGKYDALYMPRLTYHSGGLDIHDINFGNDGLYAVNTLFSCIVKMDGHYNYIPVWKPKFITELVSEDRCHLNGMAMEEGKPRFATCFSQGNSHQSWRPTVTESGCLIDIVSNEIVLENLGMPHSPRLFNGKLYVLLSATGELIQVDVAQKKYEVVTRIDGFLRGMAYHRDYLFVATSKLRENSSTFGKLQFAHKANEAAIVLVHLPTGSIAGKITYLNSVDEIYDLQVLPEKLRPNIMNTMSPEYKMGVTTPDNNYWARPQAEKP